jgi:RimJ/RimL family protein N-acetyltransferase
MNTLNTRKFQKETEPSIEVRQAQREDALKVQELRKKGWQDNYVNEETGVTRDILEKKLASLPVPQSDIDYYISTIEKEENRDKSLVAVKDGKIIGVVFYETLENGNSDIGIFVDEKFRGKGVGTKLLDELIKRTTNTLEVTIFAKNKSRQLYKKFGFTEVGEEEKHYFEDNIYLPIQRLVLSRS